MRMLNLWCWFPQCLSYSPGYEVFRRPTICSVDDGAFDALCGLAMGVLNRKTGFPVDVTEHRYIAGVRELKANLCQSN